MRGRYPFAVFSFVAVSFVSAAAAQEADLDVVVTATRTEQPLARIGDSITVIEPDAVRLSQKILASDLISYTPGVVVSRNGGVGGTTTLRIRGAESEHTVVLLDGVKLNDPSSAGGGFDFANLLIDDIARVEVLRGPQSTLWGSQAIGGVINIVTPEPQGPLSGSLSAEGGSRDTASGRARLENATDRFAWRVGGNYYTTEGISSFNERRGGSEKDGYRNVGFNARGAYQFTDALSAEVRSIYSRGRNDFDGFPAPLFALADTDEYGETNELMAYGGLKLALLDGRFKNRLGFAYTDTDRVNYDPSALVRTTFDASGRNERVEYQGTFTISSRYEATFGVESERSELNTKSPTEFDPNPAPLASDVGLDSVYAQLQASPISPLSLTAGIRYDDHDTFGSATTAHAAAAWSVGPDTILRASYGEGFKAPTLFQLFSEFGNPALEAEEAEGFDAGVEQRLFGDRLVLAGTYFYRDTTNMIDFVSCFDNEDPRCPSRPDGFYDNVQKTRSKGVELAISAQASEQLRVDANYTRMDAENAARGGLNFGRDLPRRARNVANLDVSYVWANALTTSIAAQHVGKSFDNAANTFPLDAYTVVDLRVSYTLSQKTELYGRLENALDEEYETARRYGTVGRGGFLGFRVKL